MMIVDAILATYASAATGWPNFCQEYVTLNIIHSETPLPHSSLEHWLRTIILSRGKSETEVDLPDGNLDTNTNTKLYKRQNHTVEPEVGLPEPQEL